MQSSGALRFNEPMREQLKRHGGRGLFSSPISTSNLHAPAPAAVLKYLERAGDPSALLEELKERLCAYHHAQHCVLFSTGFWALVAAIKLKAVAGKTEVIIPSFTYRRLADVVYWAGLVPVFVDINSADLAVSPAAVAEAVGPRTALILAVHPIVNCCDVTHLLNVSRDARVPIVFDAVESAHETWGGQRIGAFGEGEVFSLHASKLLNGLEGGYVCTGNSDFARALGGYARGEEVKFQGHSYLGLNGLPLPEHAAFALAGLDDLADNIAHNRAVYRAYQEGLAGVSGLRLVQFDELEQTSFKNIVIEVTKEYPLSRDGLCAILNEEMILARKHYYPPLHRKSFLYPVVSRTLPNTEQAEDHYLNLPCGARVTEAAVNLVCELLTLIGAEPETFRRPLK